MILFAITRLIGAAQELTSEQVFFSNGKFYQLDSSLYSGVVIDRWGSGRAKHSFKVENGLVDGFAKSFYENGQTRSITSYQLGKVKGTYTAYYPNGELKLQGEIGKQCREGGNEILNILYAYYNSSNQYITKVKSKARIVFITNEGLSHFFNEMLPFPQHAGYRIFDNKLADYGIFIEDSRMMESPVESNQSKMPVKRVKKLDGDHNMNEVEEAN